MTKMEERNLINEIQLKGSFCNEAEPIVNRIKRIKEEYRELHTRYFDGPYDEKAESTLHKMRILSKEYLILNSRYLKIISKTKYRVLRLKSILPVVIC